MTTTAPGSPQLTLSQWLQQKPSSPDDFIAEVKRRPKDELKRSTDDSGRTILHLAMRRSDHSWSLGEQHLSALAALDAHAFVRRDIYGATPLHHYLKSSKAPRAEIVKIVHELMIQTPDALIDAQGVDAACVTDGRKGVGSKNAYDITPLYDFFENWHLFGPTAVRRGDWNQHRDGWMELSFDAKMRECTLIQDSLHAWSPDHPHVGSYLQRLLVYAETRDYRGLAEIVDVVATMPRKKNDTETSLQLTHGKMLLPELRMEMEQNIVKIIKMIDGLNESAFECKPLVSSATKSKDRRGRFARRMSSVLSRSIPSVRTTTTVRTAAIAVEAQQEMNEEAQREMEAEEGEDISNQPISALFARCRLFPEVVTLVVSLTGSLGQKDWKKLGASFLSNKFETLDAALRLHRFCPRLLIGVVDAMSDGIAVRPGGLGELLSPLILSVSRQETSTLVRRLLTLDISTARTDILAWLKGEAVSQSDKTPQQRFLGRRSSSYYTYYSVQESYRDMMAFTLQLVSLQSEKQYTGWSDGTGLRLMARVFESVEHAYYKLSESVDRLEGSGASEDEAAHLNLAMREAWIDSLLGFMKQSIKDPRLLSGMLMHSTQHALEKLTSTVLFRVVLDEKYKRGPRLKYFFEMFLFLVLLGLVNWDLSLWGEDPSVATLLLIFLLLTYFSYRVCVATLALRRGRLASLPLHLGFMDNGKKALKAKTSSDMAWKILTDENYRKKFQEGNSGRNGSDTYDAKTWGDWHALALVYFTAMESKNGFSLASGVGSMVVTWILLIQIVRDGSGEGDQVLGVSASFCLWIDFFRRLKGATRATATFFLMLSIICRDLFVFARFFALIILMFASLFRILLSNESSLSSVHDIEDQETLDTNLATISWLLFRATIGDIGSVGELYPTSLSKVLLILLLLSTWLVLLNVLIAIIGESYNLAMKMSIRLFYGARIEILHSFSPGFEGMGILEGGFDALFSHFSHTNKRDVTGDNERLRACFTAALKEQMSGQKDDAVSGHLQGLEEELKRKLQHQETLISEMRSVVDDIRENQQRGGTGGDREVS